MGGSSLLTLLRRNGMYHQAYYQKTAHKPSAAAAENVTLVAVAELPVLIAVVLPWLLGIDSDKVGPEVGAKEGVSDGCRKGVSQLH
jgi:hypothetical protein